jgi:hypothetical protein
MKHDDEWISGWKEKLLGKYWEKTYPNAILSTTNPT